MAASLLLHGPLARLSVLASELHRRQPALAALARLFLLACIPCAMALGLDVREVNGVNVWVKPLKFALSFVVYCATLAWYFGYLSPEASRSRAGRFVVSTVLVAAPLEFLWLVVAASLGVPSHFNVSQPAWAIAYGLAGIGAVALMVAVLVQGLMLARDRGVGLPDAFRLALVLGAIVAFVGTVAFAGYLSAHGSHWVGGVPSDAAGLPLVNWSRTGGDLRVAHFWALHAHQLLPLAGWLVVQARGVPQRALVVLLAVGYSAFTLLTFGQALRGEPWIGA